MALWLKFILVIIVITGSGLSLAIWIGSIRWNGKTRRLVDKLTQPVPPGKNKTVFFDGLDHLPIPVKRYLRLVLKEDQALIHSARITQMGEFNKSKTGEDWRAFKATHYASVDPAGFLWDASIRMAPLLNVRVKDFIFAGQSSMEGKMCSLISVINAQSSLQLSTSALQRYLAEAVWYPTALLPNDKLKWTEIDESSALATLTDSGITVSLVFHFNEDGEISGVSTQERYFEEDGKFRLEPWGGFHSNYQEKSGMRIPFEGKVEWRFSGGKLPYWRGRIVEIEYDFFN